MPILTATSLACRPRSRLEVVDEDPLQHVPVDVCSRIAAPSASAHAGSSPTAFAAVAPAAGTRDPVVELMTSGAPAGAARAGS